MKKSIQFLVVLLFIGVLSTPVRALEQPLFFDESNRNMRGVVNPIISEEEVFHIGLRTSYPITLTVYAKLECDSSTYPASYNFYFVKADYLRSSLDDEVTLSPIEYGPGGRSFTLEVDVFNSNKNIGCVHTITGVITGINSSGPVVKFSHDSNPYAYVMIE